MTNQIISLLFALPVLCGLLLLWVLRTDRRRQFVQQRLHAITTGQNAVSEPLQLVLPRANAAVQLQRFDAALVATGNRIGLPHLIIAGLIGVIIAVAFAHGILALNPVLVALFGLATATAAPVLLLRMAQARYRNHFLDVFPDALDLVRRGIQAGLPVSEAMAVAGREIVDPVGSELRRALDQVQIGVQMVDALQETADRVRVADFRFLVVALALQQGTGGSLAETLTNLSGVIRARKALRLKARALSAEAKASAAILAALPFLVGGAMSVMNRDLGNMLFLDPRGRFMLGVAFISLVSGLSTMAMMLKRAVR